MARLSRGATLALACAVFLAAGSALAGVGPSLPQLARNVGHDVATLGAQFSAFAGGTVLVQVLAAPLGYRFGQRRLLMGGALLMGAGMIAESLSASLALLLLCALLAGLGFGCVLAGGNLLVARLFPARGTSALNLVNLFFGVGSIIGPLVAGAAGERMGAPQAALWLGGGLLIALAPLAPLAAEERPDPAGAGGLAAPAVPWGLVLLIGALLLVYSGTEIAVGGWAAIYLQSSAGLDTGQAALAVAGFWLALTAGRGLGALAGLRVGAQWLLLAALCLLLAGAALLLGGVGDAPRSVAALMIFGLACGPIFPTCLALLAGIAGGRNGPTNLALGVANLGGATIPPLLGLLLSWRGAVAGAWLLVGAAALMLLLLSLVATASRRLVAALR